MSFPFGSGSFPRWNENYIPSRAEWQSWWSRKADANSLDEAVSNLGQEITAEQNRAENAEQDLLARIDQIPTVKDYGAKGDGTTDDTAAIQAAVAAGVVAYVPSGSYPITDVSILQKAPLFFGTGSFVFAGSTFPSGPVTDVLQLNVPSVFPTMQAALDYCSVKEVAGGTFNIQVADGTYSVSQLESPRGDGGKTIFVRGNETTPTNCVLNFDATANKNGFFAQGGNGYAWINGFVINGIGGRNSDGSWNANCWGGAVRAIDGSSIVCGSAVKVNDYYYGFSARYGGSIVCSGATVYQAGDCGFHAFAGAIDAEGCQAVACADAANGLGFGFCAESGGFVDCSNSSASLNNVAGIYANGAHVWAHDCTADHNTLYGFYALNGGRIEATKPEADAANSYNNGSHGFYASNSGYINANSATSENNGACGFYAENSSTIDITSSASSSNTVAGYACYQNSTLVGNGAIAASNGNTGFSADTLSVVRGINHQANNNTNAGFYAQNGSFMMLNGTSGTGNTDVLYDPAVGTSANNGAYILDVT
ncbi:pectate lyase superfamily protein [Komagataeibacter europaeus]|uniref:Pectate lyase superfamily protein n=1 Tax=Komagataeibacter europaeus TaxID=33995 RepID=A0A0M0EHR1_KOMEU|nr:glycosyl hydrolase family 28-related protein [Komagataeibacter europaeus]KON64803.1 pectate lyase superfamily protein [Komagataeibacter europaeus]